MAAGAAIWTLLLTCGSGALLWLLAVITLEISCGVSLVLKQRLENPYQREGAGNAADLISLLRHIFVLVPLTVFLAYAAWVVEAAALAVALGIVAAYYTVLQYIWPNASVIGCIILALCVLSSYDAYFQHRLFSRVRQRFYSGFAS